MRRTTSQLCAMLLLALAFLSAGVTAQKPDSEDWKTAAAAFPERIWRDLGDTSSLDLTYGAGGREHAPDPADTFTFVSEDLANTSPKFEVIDGQGVKWKVKLGEESRSETAATRFLWAAGYFVDEDYYLAELTVKDLPTLHRGQKFASSGGRVNGARLERKLAGVKKLGDWDWFDNPFVGQREMNALRVMMSLVNNWDLKQVNNAVYVVNGERHFAISDLGASFGKTGRIGSQTKGEPGDYGASKFIAKDTSESIDFVMHSRPLFFFVVSPSYYRERTRMEKITKHIPRADAHWLGQRLSALSEGQIRDGFRAAGFETADVDTLTRTLRQRIAALEAL
ncbi:MAG: hypothetical protein NTV05_15630 [Acidobacteria bacterium]|nr:hypothetical protein [Acidobacteriota bacterium]